MNFQIGFGIREVAFALGLMVGVYRPSEVLGIKPFIGGIGDCAFLLVIDRVIDPYQRDGKETSTDSCVHSHM